MDGTNIAQIKASSTLTGSALTVDIGSVTVTGIGINVIGTALTTGVGVKIASSGTGLTSGSLLLVSTGTTGAVATNGIVSIAATGNYTSTSNVGLVNIVADSTTAGTVARLSGAALTTGVGFLLSAVGAALTTGSIVSLTTDSAGAIATNGIVSFRETGAFTSTSNVGFVDILASGLTGAGTVLRVKSSAAAQTASEVLRIEAAGYTTGYTGVVANFVGVATTGAAATTHSVVTITGANTTGGNMLQLSNNALTTGVGMLFAHTTSVIADTGSMLRLSSTVR